MLKVLWLVEYRTRSTPADKWSRWKTWGMRESRVEALRAMREEQRMRGVGLVQARIVPFDRRGWHL